MMTDQASNGAANTGSANEERQDTQARGSYGRATEKVGEALNTVKERTATAYSASRDKAGEAVEAARVKASLAARRAADGIDENPIAALIGGLALGAVAGALLPGTRREKEMLGPIGAKAGEAGKIAAQAARAAGIQKLAELGISSESAREQASKLFDGAVKAVGEAGSAAGKAVRGKQAGSESES